MHNSVIDNAYWNSLYCELKTGREDIVIVDGKFFVDCEGQDTGFQGFGGAEFSYVKAGKLHISHNMWNGSVIPEKYRAYFHDNAVWAKHENVSGGRV